MESAWCSFLSLRNRSRLPGKVPSWKQQSAESDEEKKLKLSLWKLLELLFLALITVGIVLTFTISPLHEKEFSGIYLWKLEILVMMLFGSRIVCGALVRLMYWVLHVLFQRHDRFIYVAYKVQGNVRRSLMAWVAVIAWQVVFAEYEVARNNSAMKFVDKGFITFGILFSVWVVKSCLVMYVAACFHMSTYNQKVLDCLFYRYVIEALRLVEFSSYLPRETDRSFIDLRKLNPKGLSSWELKKKMMKWEKCLAFQIRSESEARAEAISIFQNIAKPNSQFIDLEDLKRYLPKEDALKTINLLSTTYDDDEDIRISSFFLQEWMVHYFKRHRCLILSLNDTDAASGRIGFWFNIVIVIFLGALGILLQGIGGTNFVQFFITSSFIITFLCGQVWKGLFYSMHLLYVRHPFDVGDEVEIQETEMLVEKLMVTETYFTGKDKKTFTLSNLAICDKLLMNNNSRSEGPAWNMDGDIV